MKRALQELRRVLGEDRVAEGPDMRARYARDFGGHDLGRALSAAYPGSLEDARAVVSWARRHGIALTPVGAQTSFWASTRVEGRLVVDLRRMDRLLAVDAENLTATAQAGISVASLDAALAAQGLFLPVCPDGFGDATVGSMIANDTSAGHGMFDGSIGEHVVSLTAVLGTGEVLRTGASSSLEGLPAFSRAGLPDFTGLFLGSEGSLGLVTDVTLRVRPAPLRRALAVSGGGPDALVAAARELRHGGLCYGLRRDSHAVSGRERTLLELAAYGGPEDLAAREARAREILARRGLGAAAAPEEPRWQPREGMAAGWKGVSVALPYSNLEAVRRLWTERLRAQVAGLAAPEGEGFLRLYFGSGAAAALVGWSHRPDDQAAHERAACEIRALLLRFGVPYRIGTVWRTLVAGRLDPVYRSLLGRVKQLCDPDAILNPAVGAFPVPMTAPRARRAARRRRR